MASVGLTPYGWFDYLKESMDASSEEIDYLKRLHKLKSEQQIAEVKYGTLDSPSTITDDFLYHGDFSHARNIGLLRKLNIRHIITVCDLKLKKEILNNFNVLWIDVHDIPLANIRQHFDETNAFLHACRSKNERVLVHCQMGVSRSSAIVLAYLLKYHRNTLHEAYAHLLGQRDIAEPNDGFFLQLIRYEKDLQTSKTSDTVSTSTELFNIETVSPPVQLT